MPVTTFARLVVPGVAAAALLLAGCSGGGSDADPAADRATSSTSSTSSTTGTADRAAGAVTGGATAAPGDSTTARELAARMEEAVSAKGTVTMTIKDASGDQAIDATARLRFRDPGATPDMAMDMQTGQGSMSVVFLPGEVYLKVADLGTDGWIRLSQDGTDVLSQSFKPLLDEMGRSGTIGTLFDGADDTVTARGTRTVDGEELTVYELTSDGETATLLVDAEGLPRVVESVGGGGTTLTYSGWGEPVEIAAPPADQVVDASELAGLTGG